MEATKIAHVREELEAELTWRESEIKFLKNQLANLKNEDEKSIYRKALVVMLYSHYEGFCSFAFQTYVLTINEEKLTRKKVSSSLAAASLNQEFALFESKEYKEERFKKVFKKKAPEDSKLFNFSKRVYLLEALDDFLEQEIEIPDKVVNTESNLWPVVLKKLLYSLGLSENVFDKHEDQIKKLVNTRNGISHGKEKEGIDERTFEVLERITSDINKTIIKLIHNTLTQQEYLKVEYRG
jgi:hypothetical protein